MKRTWLLAFLFLTLWQMFPHEGYNMLYAQGMGDESYGGGYDCDDDGYGAYSSSLPCDQTPCVTPCPACHVTYACDEIDDHTCPADNITCSFCGESMTPEQYHNHTCSNQNEDGRCAICGRTIDQCSCEGPVITPNNPSVPPNNPSTGGGTHTGGGGGNNNGGNNSNGSSQNNGTNTNSNTNNHPVDTDSLCVGGHYISNQYNHLFKDSVLIPPLQTDSTTCVSTTLASTQLWVNDWPIEKFDSLKRIIEDNFYDKYNVELKRSGVGDSIIQEFIEFESGVSAMKVGLTGLKETMNAGYPCIGILVIGDGNGNPALLHEIAIIGYDNDGKFICRDPQKMELQKYTEEELSSYVSRYNKNSIYVISK